MVQVSYHQLLGPISSHNPSYLQPTFHLPLTQESQATTPRSTIDVNFSRCDRYNRRSLVRSLVLSLCVHRQRGSSDVAFLRFPLHCPSVNWTRRRMIMYRSKSSWTLIVTLWCFHAVAQVGRCGFLGRMIGRTLTLGGARPASD